MGLQISAYGAIVKFRNKKVTNQAALDSTIDRKCYRFDASDISYGVVELTQPSSYAYPLESKQDGWADVRSKQAAVSGQKKSVALSFPVSSHEP